MVTIVGFLKYLKSAKIKQLFLTNSISFIMYIMYIFFLNFLKKTLKIV